MLTRKNLIIVMAVLAVLVVLSVLQKARHNEATSRASSEVLLAGEFGRGDLDRIVVGYGGEETVVLTADDPAWLVSSAHGARADHNKIDTLLSTLGGLRGEFRSGSAEVLPDFGFTDSATVSVRGFLGDREIFALELGNKPEGSQGGFVKRPGSSDVFLSQAGVLGNLGLWSGPGQPQSRHFLDLVAYQGVRENIAAIRLEGEQTVGLKREFMMIEPAPDDTVRTEPYPDQQNWEWTLADGTMVQKTKADGIMNAAVNLRAQNVADPAPGLASYGLEPAARTVTIVMHDGAEAVMHFGDELPAEGDAPGGVFARINDEPTIWVVGTYAVDNLFKTRDELLPE